MVDGRKLRAERNQAAIVDALYTLIVETREVPSIEAVAKRAGVGVRTLFRQFEHLEMLHAALQRRLLAEALALVAPPPPSGDFDADIETLVVARVRMLVHLEPFRALARRQPAPEPGRSPYAPVRALARANLRALAGRHQLAERGDAFEALDAWISSNVWDRLRDDQGLGKTAAQRVLLAGARTLALALPRTGATAVAAGGSSQLGDRARASRSSCRSP